MEFKCQSANHSRVCAGKKHLLLLLFVCSSGEVYAGNCSGLWRADHYALSARPNCVRLAQPVGCGGLSEPDSFPDGSSGPENVHEDGSLLI